MEDHFYHFLMSVTVKYQNDAFIKVTKITLVELFG